MGEAASLSPALSMFQPGVSPSSSLRSPSVTHSPCGHRSWVEGRTQPKNSSSSEDSMIILEMPLLCPRLLFLLSPLTAPSASQGSMLGRVVLLRGLPGKKEKKAISASLFYSQQSPAVISSHQHEYSVTFPLTQSNPVVSYRKLGFHICIFGICAIFQQLNSCVN